jgi:hypothetical protein
MFKILQLYIYGGRLNVLMLVYQQREKCKKNTTNIFIINNKIKKSKPFFYDSYKFYNYLFLLKLSFIFSNTSRRMVGFMK